MTDSPLLVAVDAGTTGARAAAVDLEGRVVAEVRRPYPTSTPRPGWAEQDPTDWAERAVEALGGLARRVRASRVVGIGLTGQCPTVAPFDRSDRPTRPGMLYRDNRAVAEAEEMRSALGAEAMHRRTGHTAEAFHIGPKVLWLRREEPDAFARTVLLLQPRDVVLRRLTGEVATDESHAAATLFFDLTARRWAADLFAAFDVDPALFPPALPPRTVVGRLRRRVAEETGIRPGTPVVIGAADSQCVAFGAGVIDPGPISEMAGSSSCLNSSVLEPVADLRVTHYSHVVPDRYTTELGVNTTGAAFDWAVNALGFADHTALARAASRFRSSWKRRSPTGTAAERREAAPLFLPYLGDGDRDDPDVRAAFVGLSARHDRAALAFAVVEGVALAVRSTIEILRAAGCPTDELRAGGGGARLAVLGQVKADVLGFPVRHFRGDCAAIGTAMLAAEEAGVEQDARAAIAAAVRRSARFVPDPWGAELGTIRAGWFDEVRAARAVRVPRSVGAATTGSGT